MKKLSIALILLLFVANVMYCQLTKSQLHGQWILVKTESKDPRFHLEESKEKKTYVSFCFTGEQLYVASTPYDLCRPFNYELNNQILSYRLDRKKVAMVNDSMLVLEDLYTFEDIGYPPIRFYYHKIEHLNRDLDLSTLSQQLIFNDSLIINNKIVKRDGFGITNVLNNETICYHKRENQRPMPKFKHQNLSLSRFIQKHIGLKHNSDKSLNHVKFSFKIDKNAKLTDFMILKGNNKKLNKAVKRVMNLSKSHWEIAQFNGVLFESVMVFDLLLKPEMDIKQYKHIYEETTVISQ